jgi:hypothetical protein
MFSLKQTGLVVTSLVLSTTVAHAEFYGFNNNSNQKNASVVLEAHSQKSNDSTSIIDIRVPGFENDRIVTKGGEYQEISIDHEGQTTQVGMPKLPILRRLVEIPSDTASIRVLSVSTGAVKALSVGFGRQVLPVQAPVAKIAGAFEKAPFRVNEMAYQTNSFYPTFTARIAQVGSVRGHKLAVIEVAPVRYNPVTHEFKYVSAIRVQVVPGKSVAAHKFASNEFDSLGRSEVLNYDTKAATPTQEKLLVVVGKGFEDHAKLKELIQWKRERGFDVVVKDVKDLSDFKPETLRAYIKDVYQKAGDKPLSYVLLVGDIDQVPAYDSGMQYTDNYYAAIDKPTYDEDKVYPDLAVGRFAVQTPAELDTVVNKELRYEQASFRESTAWMKKIAFLATDDRYEVAEGTHNYVIDTYTTKLQYSGIFPNNPETGADKLYAITNHATTDDVQKSLDDSRLIVSYSGHGDYTYWAGPDVHKDQVDAIKAHEANPYVMSHACLAGSFGYSEDSFGEIWMKAPNGAIGFWGTTNSSYWDEDDILERSWFDGMFKNNVRSVGLLNLEGLAGVRSHYNGGQNTEYYYEIYNLQGDPTIELFRTSPTQLNAQFELKNENGKLHLSVGAKIANAHVVALSTTGDVLGVIRTDAQGAGAMDLDPSSLRGQNKVEVTMTAPDAIPLRQEVSVH